MNDEGRCDAVQIGGAGHSGSTLLGMMLGGASGAFYAGEAKKARFIHDGYAPLHKRRCKFCVESDCPVWSNLRSHGYAGEDHTLYASLRLATNADVIVDSSKDIEWIRARLDQARRGGLILLLRDGRAVFASRLRKYPGRSVAAIVERWRQQMHASEAAFEDYAGPKARVHYEELATNTEVVVGHLCAHFGLDYSSQLTDFAARPYHVLGGNNATQSQVARMLASDGPVAGTRHKGYYAHAPGELRLDMRWKDELSASDLRAFDTRVGVTNERYRWPR